MTCCDELLGDGGTANKDRRPSRRWQMLRFYLGVTRNDRITNEYIRRTAHVKQFDEKRLREKTEMAWTCAEEGWIY